MLFTVPHTKMDQVASYLIGLARKYPWRATKEPVHPRHRCSLHLGKITLTLQFMLVQYGVRKFYSLKIISRDHIPPQDDLCNYVKGYFFKDHPEDVSEIKSSHAYIRTFINEELNCDHQCDTYPSKHACQDVSL